MARQSRPVGTGVKPVVVRSLPATAAVLVVGLVMAGMMTTAAMMLVARPTAMTVRRWRSRRPDRRMGWSRRRKLSEARAVARRAARRATVMTVTMVPRAMASRLGQVAATTTRAARPAAATQRAAVRRRAR